MLTRNGDVAQLGERSVRNAEAEGSIPFISTRILPVADLFLQFSDFLIVPLRDLVSTIFIFLDILLYKLDTNWTLVLKIDYRQNCLI